MATITYVFTMNYVAKMLGEDPELLEAVVSNGDNLSFGSIISVYDGTDEAITALTDNGIEELRQMLAHARYSTEEWNDFFEDFVTSSQTQTLSRASERNLRVNSPGDYGDERNRESSPARNRIRSCPQITIPASGL